MARGNRHVAMTRYAYLTPFHIGTLDGFFRLEGIVPYIIIYGYQLKAKLRLTITCVRVPNLTYTQKDTIIKIVSTVNT